MSTNTLADAIADAEQNFIRNCLTVVAFVAYSYDRCLTVSKEFDLIWRHRSMSLATGLYMLLHMSMAVYQCILIAGMRVYNGYIFLQVQACAITLFLVANGGFMALRAYAISNRSIALASTIMLLSSVNVAFNIYQMCELDPGIPGPAGLGSMVSMAMSAGTLRLITVTQQVCNILAETLLVAATWRHASIAKAASKEQLGTRLTMVLLRDGTLHFAAILVLLVATTVQGMIDMISGYSEDYGANLVYVLRIHLLSHFYVNLREANCNDLAGSSIPSQPSDLRFASVVGPLAGSLPYGMNDSTSTDTDEEDLDEGLQDVQGAGVEKETLATTRGSTIAADDAPAAAFNVTRPTAPEAPKDTDVVG